MKRYWAFAVAQWDRVIGWTCVGGGALLTVIGALSVSRATHELDQLSYLASGPAVGLFLLGVGAILILSADLRDEWRKLDEVASVLRHRETEPAPEITLSDTADVTDEPNGPKDVVALPEPADVKGGSNGPNVVVALPEPADVKGGSNGPNVVAALPEPADVKGGSNGPNVVAALPEPADVKGGSSGPNDVAALRAGFPALAVAGVGITGGAAGVNRSLDESSALQWSQLSVLSLVVVLLVVAVCYLQARREIARGVAGLAGAAAPAPAAVGTAAVAGPAGVIAPAPAAVGTAAVAGPAGVIAPAPAAVGTAAVAGRAGVIAPAPAAVAMAGDPAPGDPAPGDPAPGDPAPGDPAPGASRQGYVVAGSQRFHAAGCDLLRYSEARPVTAEEAAAAGLSRCPLC